MATIVSDATYARQVADRLAAAGLRAETDLRNEKINYKVREHLLAKVPVLLVVGKREMEEAQSTCAAWGSRIRFEKRLDEAIAALRAEATAPDLRRGTQRGKCGVGAGLGGTQRACTTCSPPLDGEGLGVG